MRSEPKSSPQFDGSTFVPDRDGSRLASQLADVRDAMSDGKWWSLGVLAVTIGHPEASISARIRDLRKVRNGGHTVERRHITNGLWHYRLVLPKGQLSLGLM